MKELKPNYFSHDTNASNDPKIINIRMSFGWKAIGMYWAIIEALHKEESGELPKHLISSMILDFYSQEEIREMRHTIEEAKEFEEALYANALLIVCDSNATSKRVKENLLEIKDKSNKARQSAMLRWDKNAKIKHNNNNAKAMRRQCEGNAIKERKGKENKVKEINTLQAEPADNINPLIKEFEIINPTINYGNTTQRNALKEMIKQFGYDKLLATIKFAVSIQGKPYSPTITTPCQLKENMGKLLVYYKKEEAKKPIII